VPDAGPAGDSEIRNRYNEKVRWEILLLEPVKAGRWSVWYAEAIPLAEERYAVYRREADEEEE
jgi:hypothetical protein